MLKESTQNKVSKTGDFALINEAKFTVLLSKLRNQLNKMRKIADIPVAERTEKQAESFANFDVEIAKNERDSIVTLICALENVKNCCKEIAVLGDEIEEDTAE